MQFFPPAADWELAEVNIARLLAPMTDPKTQPFVDALDRINSIAERMDGFLWRHVDTGTSTFCDDPLMIYNASVWCDLPSLERFVWGTVHARFVDRRAEWFGVLESVQFAMWWVPPRTRVTFKEAKSRLAHLGEHGPSEYAFGWPSFPSSERPDTQTDPAL
ncbi:DUF3291 domain-containing protein [Rhodobacteraceae bacterium SC52]|nr:DUF3291 domain-containing protein [Rhodobacteraceae bacterium SC52]